MKKYLMGFALTLVIAGSSGTANAAWYDWLFGNLGECETVSTADSVIFPNAAGDAVILLTQDLCW